MPSSLLQFDADGFFCCMWSTYMCSHSTVLLVLLLQHRALLNPLVEDRNGWFCVRLLHVLEPSTTLRRGAESSACFT